MRGGWRLADRQGGREGPDLRVLGVVEQLQRGLQQDLNVGHVAAEVLLHPLPSLCLLWVFSFCFYSSLISVFIAL